MPTEAAVAKLRSLFGPTRARQQGERLVYTPVAKDILWPAEGEGT